MSNSSARDKIKKLLNLSRDAGATEDEAATALKMATIIMLKHGITEESMMGHVPGMSETVLGTYAKNKSHLNMLLQCVSTLAILKSFYRTYTKQVGYCVVGDNTSRENAQYLWDYLYAQVEAQYKIHLPPGMTVSDRANFRRTFKHACSARLSIRCTEIMAKMRIESPVTGKELVVTEYAGQKLAKIGDWMANNGYHVRTVSRKTKKAGRGTVAGWSAADQIKIREELR